MNVPSSLENKLLNFPQHWRHHHTAPACGTRLDTISCQLPVSHQFTMESYAATTSVNASNAEQPDFSQAFPFSANLDGVQQKVNWLLIHMTITLFCGIVAITIMCRLVARLSRHIRHVAILSNPQRQAFWERNQQNFSPWLKQHLLYAPLFGARHNRALTIFRNFKHNLTLGAIPGRGLVMLLALYGYCNLVYCLWVPWQTPTDQFFAALRGRCGILAALNLIPTVLFALRNNPLIWILQISYDTFNLFHRWLARLTILLALAHAFAWFCGTLSAGGWEAVHLGFFDKSHGLSFQAGLVGTVVFSLIFMQAWSPLRHAFYETFLNLHKVLIAIGLSAVYLHWKVDRIQQLPWFKVCAMLWVLEYVVRASRIVFHNISWKRGISQVTVEALPCEACRVTFRLAGYPLGRITGTHSHIYLPKISLHSSHPFSIAWADDNTRHSDVSLPVYECDTKSFISDGPPKTTCNQVSFVVRARDGFTRKLFDRAKAAKNGTFETWGFIEGPYGGHHSLASYGTVLLFAGGVGITHQMPFVRDLIRDSHHGLVGVRRIVLVWSIPSTEALEWIRAWMAEILQLPGRKDLLTVQVFVTKPKGRRDTISSSGSIHLHPGRCNPQVLIDKEVISRIGAMAITVCGPGAFSDDVRSAARKRVQTGVIDFVEEAFTY